MCVVMHQKTKYWLIADLIESIPRLGNFVVLAGFYGDLGLYEMLFILPICNLPKVHIRFVYLTVFRVVKTGDT